MFDKKISSFKNEEIKNLVRLKKSKERKKQNLFLIEGRHEISLACEAGVRIKKLYYSPEFPSDENFIVNIPDTVLVEKEVFNSLSQRENPDGYIALAMPETLSLENIRLGKDPLVLIIEGVEKPGNIGAILRTADAVKADAVMVCDSPTDIYNPNVIRASLGTVFTNRLAVCTSEEALLFVKNNGLGVYSATPEAEKYYTEMDFVHGAAIVIGSEHSGLSAVWMDGSTGLIKIPMFGKVDSLNASVSAAVVLYEAARQRGFGAIGKRKYQNIN